MEKCPYNVPLPRICPSGKQSYDDIGDDFSQNIMLEAVLPPTYNGLIFFQCFEPPVAADYQPTVGRHDENQQEYH